MQIKKVFLITVLLLFTLSLTAEKILYRSRAYIAPQKLVRNEVSKEEAKKKREELKKVRERRLNASVLSETYTGGRIYKTKDGRIFVNGKFNFILVSRDKVSGSGFVKYKIDNGIYRYYKKPFRIKNEGKHRIEFYAADKIGNKSNPVFLYITVDDTPPQITVEPVSDFYYKNNNYYIRPGGGFEISIRDKYSGVLAYYVDTGSGFLKGEDKAYIFTKKGKKIIRVVAIDRLKNKSDTTLIFVVVDAVPPYIKIETDTPVRLINGKNFCKFNHKIRLVSEDTLSGVKKILYKTKKNGNWKVYKKSIYISREGYFYMEAKSVDNVGNESLVKKLECIVDSVSPESKILPSAGGKT